MKLYWRVKKNGKWTWRPAQVTDELVKMYNCEWQRKLIVEHLEEEE